MAKRSRQFETWLRSIISEYRSGSRRVRGRRFSGFFAPGDPTQIYGVAMRAGGGWLLTCAVLHLPDKPDRLVRVWTVDGTDDLAGLADDATRIMELPPLPSAAPSLSADEKVPVATDICLELAETIVNPAALPRGRAQVGDSGMLRTEPDGAMWSIGWKPPRPSVWDFLKLMSAPPRRIRVESTPQRGAKESKASAYFSYADPPLWFGPFPHPTPGETVRGKTNLTKAREVGSRTVAQGPVLGREVRLSQKGRVLAICADRHQALEMINLVFAAASRSGVNLAGASADELQTALEIDAASGEPTLTVGHPTPRDYRFNRFGWLPTRREICICVPESFAQSVVVLANQTAADSTGARQALRLLDAETTLLRGHHAESLMTAWSVVESWLAAEFSTYWADSGRSKTQLNNMLFNWTASQQIDFLGAISRLSPTDWTEASQLNGVRNRVVHRLDDPASEESQRRIDLAHRLTNLPRTADSPQESSVMLRDTVR